LALRLERKSLRREAYARRDGGDVHAAHAFGACRDQPVASRVRVGDERVDIDVLTMRRERAQALDPLFEERRRSVEVAIAPVMKTDADLEDAVVQASDRCARVAPQELERLVLLEELAGVELLDAVDQLWRC